VTGRKSISIRNVSNDSWEKLEFPDRVIKVALGYSHLVVVTPSQCHIYTTKNWNTPVIFDLREGSVCMLLLAERLVYFLQGKLYRSFGDCDLKIESRGKAVTTLFQHIKNWLEIDAIFEVFMVVKIQVKVFWL